MNSLNPNYPVSIRPLLRMARRLEIITLVMLSFATFLMFFVVGESVAMMSVWIEDLLGLIPPLCYLVSSKLGEKKPNPEYPYGLFRAKGIGYLTASLAINIVGLLLVLNSSSELVTQSHPTLGTYQIFGRPIWSGWVMIVALCLSIVPPMILGHLKLPLAHQLHDKILHADAKLNKADWLTGLATLMGLIGIYFGLWWMDAVAALFVSVDVFHDGFKNLQIAVTDLMDRRPVGIESQKEHPLTKKILEYLIGLPWVESVEVRLREQGNFFFGEAFFVPKGQLDLAQIETARKEIGQMDWHIIEMALSPVSKLTTSPLNELFV